MRNSCFVLALRYCCRSKLVFTSFCFQIVPKPELTSLEQWTETVKNGHKKAIIPYHSLRKSPFDVLLNSFIVCITVMNSPSRIIQFHHVTYTNERFFWPHVETRLLIALFFLPFGTPDSGSKFRRYQVFIRYHWASAGMTKGNRLSKRKRNVLRRDDYFYFHHYSFQICITDQAWGQYDWIYGQIPFLHFVKLSRSPLFFPVWLCHETSSLAARPHALKLVFAHF